MEYAEDLEMLGKSRSELAFIVSASAVEIDNYSRGNTESFDYTSKLKGIFEIYQLKDDASVTDFLVHPHSHFPYSSLLESFNKIKAMRHASEVALEMKLLRQELENIPGLSQERLKDLSSFLCDYSKQLLSEDSYFARFKLTPSCDTVFG